MQSKADNKKARKEVFEDIVDAFSHKYGWLGAQASREMLLSVASWNINKYSDTHMRYRNHLMLAWERGWVKSTMMRKMAKILGDEFCSTIGKVTGAAMRGSVSEGQFTPPKPLKSPIVISTEFGQTSFDDELLNIFLALLEEGETNISMNKIGSLPKNRKQSIEQDYGDQISFGERNEFDLSTDFVFWGATYDPGKLEDDALRSRFNVITPEKPLSSDITKRLDNNRFTLDQSTVKACRKMLHSKEPVETDFAPPESLYEKYSIIPRESRDIQAYMAARNWWGMEVNPEIMEKYIRHLKKSRKRSTMTDKELVYDLIFDTPMTMEAICETAGLQRKDVYQLLNELNASRVPSTEGVMWCIFSRDKEAVLEKHDIETSKGDGLASEFGSE